MTRRIGRPTKLTPGVRRQLLDLVGRGASIRRACTIAGVDEVTFYRWLSHDERFRYDATQARHRGIQAALDSVRRAGDQRAGATDWRATVAWLHLINAEEFASQKLDERYVQEQKRELAKTLIDKLVQACDELLLDPELRHRFMVALGTTSPAMLEALSGFYQTDPTPPTARDMPATNGHAPMLREPR